MPSPPKKNSFRRKKSQYPTTSNTLIQRFALIKIRRVRVLLVEIAHASRTKTEDSQSSIATKYHLKSCDTVLSKMIQDTGVTGWLCQKSCTEQTGQLSHNSTAAILFLTVCRVDHYREGSSRCYPPAAHLRGRFRR